MPDHTRRVSAQETGFILVFLLIVGISAAGAIRYGISAKDIAVIGFLAVASILVAFAAAVLWQIVNGRIPLVGLISEPAGDLGGLGKASLSRFQFLIFTFVIAGLFLMLCIETGGFVEIPANVLGLLGISGGSFVISKAVGNAGEPKVPPLRAADTVVAEDPPAAGRP